MEEKKETHWFAKDIKKVKLKSVITVGFDFEKDFVKSDQKRRIEELGAGPHNVVRISMETIYIQDTSGAETGIWQGYLQPA